jgi:hypothetical protein
MKRKANNLLLLLCMAMGGHAQTEGFLYGGRLDTVKQAGFYNIAIAPPVNARSKPDLSDLRIVNDSGRWVPHLLRIPATEYHVALIISEMPIVSKTVSPTAVTCVVKNSEPLVSTIELVMKNTSAQRSCSISGSMNGSDWFIINDSILLNETALTKGSETTCRLQFPPSGYPYFKLVVDSKKTDPVNILRLGSVGPETVAAPAAALKRWEENPQGTVMQMDSGRISYVRVTQPDSYLFERLALQVEGVKYFSRKADIYVAEDNGHRFAKPGRWLHSITLSNNSTLEFVMPAASKTAVFYLLIHNNDNLPLRIKSVKTAIQYRVLTAYLEKGSGYRLLTGNAKAVAPIYDLAVLQGKLPDSIPGLGLGSFGPMRSARAQEAAAAPKGYGQYLLWGSIALVLAVLIYLTFTMLREMEKRKNGGEQTA